MGTDNPSAMTSIFKCESLRVGMGWRMPVEFRSKFWDCEYKSSGKNEEEIIIAIKAIIIR